MDVRDKQSLPLSANQHVDFVAIDFETATSDPNSACAVGLAFVVMATGTGAYHGSREAKFTILPRTVSAQALQIEAGCQKEYDGTTKASPTVSVQVLPGDRKGKKVRHIPDHPVGEKGSVHLPAPAGNALPVQQVQHRQGALIVSV